MLRLLCLVEEREFKLVGGVGGKGFGEDVVCIGRRRKVVLRTESGFFEGEVLRGFGSLS